MTPEIIILGAGESGIGAALLAQWLGERVFVSDAGSPKEHFLQSLFDAGIEYEVGGHDEARILVAKLVVKSPGIPDTAPLVQSLIAKGIEVISEIEYAYRHRPANSKIVAITGSNGKTTTTMLVNQLLMSGGLNVRMGGNIGTSFARLVLADLQNASTALESLTYVLELSSFQLDGLVSFRADVAAILNITPDHLDRYNYDIKQYADSKLSIAKNQQAEDKLLIYYNDTVVGEAYERANPKAEEIDIYDGQIGDQGKLFSKYDTFDLTTTRLQGRHNALNALFAIRIAQELKVPTSRIQTGLDTFLPAAHRMESVAAIKGIHYINDSKATNVEATFYALEAMQTPLVWIAGGTDKGNDYKAILPLVKGKVRALVCLGVDNEKLLEAFAQSIPVIVETRSMQDAIDKANELAKTGDTVLLSPACASFDLFKNYIDRGDQFKTIVRAGLAVGDVADQSNQTINTSSVKKNKTS